MSELPDGNPKSIMAVRKPALHRIPSTALVEASIRFMASPHEPYNWRVHPIALTVYADATMRHILGMLDGEWIDPECQYRTSHASGLVTNGSILIDAYRT